MQLNTIQSQSSIQQPAHQKAQAQPAQRFADVLAGSTVKFSAHAQSRMTSRNIEMTPEIMGKLNRAVDSAAAKGSKDSLVLLRNLAFIVNIPNRTVVTAMDGSGMKENIVTNIDSTVLAD